MRTYQEYFGKLPILICFKGAHYVGIILRFICIQRMAICKEPVPSKPLSVDCTGENL